MGISISTSDSTLPRLVVIVFLLRTTGIGSPTFLNAFRRRFVSFFYFFKRFLASFCGDSAVLGFSALPPQVTISPVAGATSVLILTSDGNCFLGEVESIARSLSFFFLSFLRSFFSNFFRLRTFSWA